MRPSNNCKRLGTMTLEQLYDCEPPEFLFHYTSSVGMLGILDSRCIWATEIRYLNDAKELVNTVEFLSCEVSERISSAEEFEAEVLRDFRSWLSHRASGGHAMFVASLTENGNLLSQWRGYTPSSGGVSLGFSASRLRQMGIPKGFRLGRCIYDEQEQQNIARKIVDEVLVAAATFDYAKSNGSRHESVRHYPLFETLEERIFFGAALLKHHSFQEEKEWRLVSSFVPDQKNAAINFRPGKSCLIPYLKFNLNDEDSQLTVLKLANVGPTPNPNLAMNSVSIAFSQHVSGGHTIRNTMLPLRQV